LRYIDSSSLAQPNGWLIRAERAKQAVADGDSPDTYGNVWRELKDGLADILYDKCWYCEMYIARSDNAVDHFRPKGRVSDASKAHGGYSWLAFELTNFRYACTYCNSRRKDQVGDTSGGKADRFPLLNEIDRVYLSGSVARERPKLLDPCELDDWRLLGCQRENGYPCAASTDTIAKERAEISIQIYHLHHEPTCKSRHRLAVQLISDVADGIRLFEQAKLDPDHESEFKKVAARLLRTIARNAPFSGDMRFLLSGQRNGQHTWIQKLLEA
jgi:hypothetical protein